MPEKFYDYNQIELKWFDRWQDATFYRAAENSTAPKFSVSSANGALRGVVTGPAANFDLLPGPILIDRIGVTAFDAAGHLLASGSVCVHGCIGWPTL